MKFFHRIRTQFSKQKLDQELFEELTFHIEKETEENIAAGMSEEEARYAALRKFGGIDQMKEECRDAWGLRFIETLFQDLSFAARMLANSPGFTAVAIITLALGIGVNTAIFSLLHDTILARLPISHPEELVQLTWQHGTEGWSTFNWPDYEPLLTPQPALPGLFACLRQEMNLRAGIVSERVRAHLVSGSYYSTLGVKAILGRTLVAGDDQPAAAPAAVLSYSYWGRRFGFDPAAVGQPVYLNGTPFTVVGVAPPEFFGMNRLEPPDITCPLRVTPLPEGNSYYVSYFARLQPGVSIEQARAQVGVRFHTLLDEELKSERNWMGKLKLDVISGANGEKSVHMLLGDPLRVLSIMVGVLLVICSTRAFPEVGQILA